MIASVALVAAGDGGYTDFVAGLLIGVAVGFLLGPAVRSWLVWREWGEASRQARLTDEVLARMEQDMGLPEGPELEDPLRASSRRNQGRKSPRPTGGRIPPRRWQALP